MLSTSLPAMALIKAKARSIGIAAIRPKAVVFMATEMEADNRSAFCAGSALATAVNALIRPRIVPSRPSRVAMLAKVPM